MLSEMISLSAPRFWPVFEASGRFFVNRKRAVYGCKFTNLLEGARAFAVEKLLKICLPRSEQNAAFCSEQISSFDIALKR